MRILFIDNAAMIKADNCYYIHIKNGELINALKKAGHEVSAFQFETFAKSISTFDLRKNGVGILPQRLKRNKLLSYFSAYINLIRAVFKTDVVYMYYPNSFRLALPICWLIRKKYGVYVRGMVGAKSRFSKWVYKHASFVIETGKFAEETNGNVYLPRPMINYTEKDINENRKYPDKIEQLNLLFLGRLDRDKGLYELIEAISVLKEERQKVKLTIVGNGAEADNLKTLVENLRLMDYINFWGSEYNSDKIKELYSSAHAYIIPTYHEGFPRTIYEAMIFGTPVITTMVGGIPDIMVDGKNCMAIKVKSVESIVSVLHNIIDNYAGAICLAKNGFNTIREVLQRETHADTLVKEVQKLI